MSRFAASLFAIGVILTIHGTSAAVLLQDRFDSGTNGWTVGAPSPVKPTHIIGDGPAGNSDNYLFMQALGFAGPGGRLAVFNETQWTGNFTDFGILGIEVDLRNFGATPLTIRFALQGVSGGTHRVATSDAHTLPAFSQWEHATFSLAPGDLIGDSASDDPLAALQNVTQLRLIHNPSPAFRGEIVNTAIGIDNIQAIPEPAPMALFLLGLITIMISRGRPERQLFLEERRLRDVSDR